MSRTVDTHDEHDGFEGSLRSRILIASPAIDDRRFERSVIFMCVHTPQHAMGVIVNKAMGDLRLPELLNQLGVDDADMAPDRPVLNGGPVDRDRGFVLHSADYASEDSTLQVSPSIGLTATKDVLEALATQAGPRCALLVVGYAAWGPGQLEDEIMENAWLVGDADEELLFSEALDDKWALALERIGVSADKLSALHGKA